MKRVVLAFVLLCLLATAASAEVVFTDEQWTVLQEVCAFEEDVIEALSYWIKSQTAETAEEYAEALEAAQALFTTFSETGAAIGDKLLEMTQKPAERNEAEAFLWDRFVQTSCLVGASLQIFSW